MSSTSCPTTPPTDTRGSARRWPPSRLPRAGPLHLPRRHRRGRLPPPVGLGLAFRRHGLDPRSRRAVVLPPVRPAAAGPGLGQRRGAEDFKTTLRFWADRGVDGYRVDVAHALAKDLSEPLRSKPTLYDSLGTDGNDVLFDRDAVRDLRRVAGGLRRVRPAPDRGGRGVCPLRAPRPLRPADRAGPGVQLRPAEGRLRRRPVPGGDRLLPGRGGPGRLFLDLGAVQPRRGPAHLALRPADRRRPGRVADERRRPAAARRDRRPPAGPGSHLADARAARPVLPLPGRGARSARGLRPARVGAAGPYLAPDAQHQEGLDGCGSRCR